MQAFPVAAPVRYSNDFGAYRRGPPVHTHQGNDLFAPMGAEVFAVEDGVVSFTDGGLGGMGINLTTADGTRYYYAHLSSREVANGTRVTAGQLIARVGDSGNARGGATHLHFEWHPGGGGARNPYDDLRRLEGLPPAQPPAPPMPPESASYGPAFAAFGLVALGGVVAFTARRRTAR